MLSFSQTVSSHVCKIFLFLMQSTQCCAHTFILIHKQAPETIKNIYGNDKLVNAGTTAFINMFSHSVP